MKALLRCAGWAVGVAGALVLLVAASMLLALASVGVFASSGVAWTTELRGVGLALKVNVPALVRLATLPGVLHLLDGRNLRTRAGTLEFARDGAALQVRCAPCRITHPDLAAATVELRSISVALAREGDAIDGTVHIDRVALAFRGRLRSDGIDFVWTLPPTDFGVVVDAFGAAVREAAFARIEGRITANGTLALPARRMTIQWNAEELEVGGLGTERLQYGWFRFACAQPDGAMRLTLTGDGEKPWVALDATGPYLAAAVLAAEDQRYWQHAGYDADALAELLADIEDGRPRRGASTITQQLARTLFTGGDRTAARKLREFLYAVEMERTLGKNRIVELYLNTVDWGPGICGAKAAARVYFNKTPARLSAIEAAWLAGVLRNPHIAWHQQFAPREADRARATQVLMQMRDWPKRERQRMAAQPLAFAPLRKPRSDTIARPLLAQPAITPSEQLR